METIRFGADLPELPYYEKRDWLLNETRIVEFFPDKYYEVTLITTAEDNNILKKYLSKIDTKLPIAIDLEWEDELCLFQFCYESTVVIIRHPKGPGNKFLFNFLKDHFFYGKGIKHDLQKLFEKFNYDFTNNIEDIARTRLEPYGHSINFIQMTLQFAGKPTAEFKDVRITKSNWDLPELSMRQVLYAAFDVVAISVAYPNFPAPMEISHIKKKQKSVKKIIRRSENDFNPEKDNKRRYNRIMKEKYQSTERILCHNRIVLKQSQAQKTHCYLISNYEGPFDCVTLKKDIFGSLPKKDIDHVGCCSFEKCIIVSLFVDHPELNFFFKNNEKIKIEKLETVNPDDCTDNDVLFIPFVFDDSMSELDLSLLFYSFGFDIRFNVVSNLSLKFIRIQPHRAQQSFIVKTFFPKVVGVQIHAFPDFVPVVRCFMPPNFDEEKIKNLFISNMNNVKNIEVSLLRRKTENSEQNALVTFSSVKEADEAVEKINYKKVDDFICYAQRYTDENHIRFMRFFELTVENNIDYNKNNDIIEDHSITTNYEVQVRNHYSKYGPLFQCRYDRIFNVYRVQFIDRNDAALALNNEKNASFPPTGTMAFVRNLPFTITDEEVLDLIKPYGKVIGFLYREIDEFMRSLVVEVTYTCVDEAHAIKKALHQKNLYGEELEVNVVNTLETEAPIWKMQQRKFYIKLNALNKPEHENESSEEGENQNKKEETNDSNQNDSTENTQKIECTENDQKSDMKIECTENDQKSDMKIECSENDQKSDTESKDDSNMNESEKVEDENLLYSSDVDHIYYITNYHEDDDDDDEAENEDTADKSIEKVTAIGPQELIHYLSQFGHVIDLRGDYVMYLTFKEATTAQSQIEGSSLITTNEFVQEIFPGDFSVINVEYLKKPFRQSQPMAVVIDPLPKGLTDQIINGYLEGIEGYFIVIDEVSPENHHKAKKESNILEHSTSDQISSQSQKTHDSQNHIDLNDYSDDEESTEDDDEDNLNQTSHSQPVVNNDMKNRRTRAIVYTKSKRAMNIVHSKLHNQMFNGELLNLSKYAWHRVPQRPKNLHPFAELNPPRKQPIIVDPIPNGTKAVDVRKACEGCGKFDVKVEGSAEKVGMCRAVVQPRNIKAKVNCLLALENTFGKAKRYPRDEVPPILQENLEEESDYE